MGQKMGGVQYEVRDSRRVPVSRTYQLPAHEKTSCTTEAIESRGLGAGEET